MNKFSSFAQFYPYYLSEHRHPVCRALHYIGSALVIIVLLYALWTQQWRWLWLLPLIGYGFAWVGHFAFEHNRPATFKHPFYSLAADWVMLKDFLTGKLKRKLGAN
ncbi:MULTISPECIES: DUF962 domain-containing protein [Rheinheimera]|uniref:DUF962 domain-containing protein n=1 Tax=Rheinheimera aquimaris TaxID=412437 RepID=A0ABN1E2G2_9GAMM|nr:MULTISPECIES: DUF962 domain-containing protein [Rheinheimera]MCB5214738.1 DUF962 domain-containing protein [Rheinheimera aquimaris]